MYAKQGVRARYRGRAWLAQWVSDLRLGVRLAIGGGRTSKTGVARLVLGTIGIGLAVAVLLVGASAGPMFNARNDRENAQAERTDVIPGVDPLYVRGGITHYRQHDIDGTYVATSGPRAPLPPGLDRLPGDGEIVLSPALSALLASPEGEGLRARFPQRVIGTIDRIGVTDADTLSFYAGDSSIDRDDAQLVYGYGQEISREMPPELVVLIAIGVVVLLVPVLVFIATSARIAGAERDRRLAALRLVGADSKQARRIAAAESLASAGTGLVFGVGLFFLFRSLVGNFPVLGVRAYPGDVTPPWPLALLIVLVVPLLAVVTAQVALRRTIIEPLGVVRLGRPTRRRLWWRLVPLVLGPLLLLSQGSINRSQATQVPVVAVGAAMLLLGIPAVLPWLLERVVARLRGGRPSVQLAIRRLQLDSGTPARVVGGVAVVLAGAIALDAVLASQTAKYDLPSYLADARVDSVLPAMTVSIDGGEPEAVAGSVASVPGVRSTVLARQFYAEHDRNTVNAVVVDCAVLLRYQVVKTCADGAVFGFGDRVPPAGQPVTVMDFSRNNGPVRTDQQLTLPATVGKIDQRGYTAGVIGYFDLVATPGAIRGLNASRMPATLAVFADSDRLDVLEGVRTAVAPYGWRARVDSNARYISSRSQTLELFLTVRNGLLGGALFTLLLAGISMLVLALEQMRERRRPLAALAASGVPTGTIARSLLWQNTVPVVVAVAVAVLTGIGLAELVFRLIDEPFSMDWLSVGMYSAVATVLVLLVTAMIMPTLRSATRLAALRME